MPDFFPVHPASFTHIQVSPESSAVSPACVPKSLAQVVYEDPTKTVVI